MLADQIASVRLTLKNSHLDNLFIWLQRHGQRELLILNVSTHQYETFTLTDKIDNRKLASLKMKNESLMRQSPSMAVEKLCTIGAEKQAHIAVVYGLHHPSVSTHPFLQWVNAIKKQLECNASDNDKRPVIIAVFPNTDKNAAEVLESLNIPLIDMGDESAVDQLDKLPDSQIMLAKMPGTPRSMFNKLIDCSDYPALTEGANMTSYLLQTGHPYLSLLPKGDTPVPQDIGDALEAMKAAALSYKLDMDDNDRQTLTRLSGLIQSVDFEEALTLIDDIKKFDDSYNPLRFLWGAINTYQNPQSKPLITVETLLKKCQILKESGKSLGGRGMEAMMAAVDPGLDCYVSYLNN